MKGVDAIEHTASPFHTNVTEPEGRFPLKGTSKRVLESNRLLSEFFRPAIQGTVGILKSAFKNGWALLCVLEGFSPNKIYYSTNVKRIVVTSSTTSVMYPPAVPTMFSEKDWNETGPKEVEEKGSKAPPMTIYGASKTLAERGESHEMILLAIQFSFVLNSGLEILRGGQISS